MKPIIGISANYKDNCSTLAQEYYRAVVEAGGLPIIIPVTNNKVTISQTIKLLDGLILSGGGDINPKYFGESPIPENGEISELRDEYDLILAQTAAKHQLPILGICRGMQLLNVLFGGSIYQDIVAQYDGFNLNHSQEQPKNITTQIATIIEGSKLYKILNINEIEVNSIHHQAVRRIANGFGESAFTIDGICEAIESRYYPILGVQWHPEHLANFESHLKLFKYLIEEAEIFKKAKLIHKKAIIADSHCDTPMFFHYPEVNIAEENENIMVAPSDLDTDSKEQRVEYSIKVNVPKMAQGLVDTIFTVAYIPQKELSSVAFENAEKKADYLLNKLISQIEQNSHVVGIATSVEDVVRLKQEGKKSVFLAIENGYALGSNIDAIDKYSKLGVKYITLCHNGDNQICDSAQKSETTNNGLSPFGRLVVEKMNQLGIIIDISHASEKTFWDVINVSKKPIIASHSCAKALRDHPRNLTDEQIKAVAKQGGVCQVCLYHHFLTDLPVATINDAIKHINYIVNLVGADYVGVGSDFDGGGGIMGCVAENELINITKELIKHDYSTENIAKIMGGNILRVVQKQK